MPEDEFGYAMTRAFYYISSKKNGIKALSFLTDVYEKLGNNKFSEKSVQTEIDLQYPDADEDLFTGENEYSKNDNMGKDFLKKTGLNVAPQVLINGVPLRKDQLSGDAFEEAAVTTILRMTSELQKEVYHGNLNDKSNLLDYWMEKKNVMPRLNNRILSNDAKILDFSIDSSREFLDDSKLFRSLPIGQMSSSIADNAGYIAKSSGSKANSLWVITDVETVEGRALLYDAIKQLKHSNTARLTVIFNPVNFDNLEITKVIYTALKSNEDISQKKNFITKFVKEDNVADLKNGKKTWKDFSVHNMNVDKFENDLKNFNIEHIKSFKIFSKKVIGCNDKLRMAILSNGKVIGPFENREEFTVEDFGLLDKFSYNRGGEVISKKLKSIMKGENDDEISNKVLKVFSLLSSLKSTETRKDVKFLSEKYSVINKEASSKGPAFEILAILDPTSKAAQKYTPLISVLSKVTNVNLKIFLNCREKLSEMPLKR